MHGRAACRLIFVGTCSWIYGWRDSFILHKSIQVHISILLVHDLAVAEAGNPTDWNVAFVHKKSSKHRTSEVFTSICHRRLVSS